MIGLELGQALSRLGVRVRLFGRDHLVGPLSDPDVTANAAKIFENEFPAHWHADTTITRDADDVIVSWKDKNAGEERFDYLIAATGRRHNLDKVALENTSFPLDERGIPLFDPLSGRIGNSHVFIAGDATADIPLLHEAANEGRLAGENAGRFPHAFRRARRANLGIVFSDPQICIAGASYKSLTDQGIEFETGAVSFENQGRARVMGINKGRLHVYGKKGTGRFLGAEMVGPAAEHIAHLLV